MAIYHFHAQVIKRSAGKSATAAAAYRSGSKIEDERTGKTHDYTKKGGVEYSKIITPGNAPEWANQREKLWNHVEAKENRHDAQVCREFDIALPNELNKKQQENLIERYCRKNFSREGMCADISIHRPGPPKPENPHAHVMVTMRTISKEGFGNKNRDWNDRSFNNKLRENWAKETNLSLKRVGSKERITHERTCEGPSLHYGKNSTYKDQRVSGKSLTEQFKGHENEKQGRKDQELLRQEEQKRATRERAKQRAYKKYKEYLKAEKERSELEKQKEKKREYGRKYYREHRKPGVVSREQQAIISRAKGAQIFEEQKKERELKKLQKERELQQEREQKQAEIKKAQETKIAKIEKTQVREIMPKTEKGVKAYRRELINQYDKQVKEVKKATGVDEMKARASVNEHNPEMVKAMKDTAKKLKTLSKSRGISL